MTRRRALLVAAAAAALILVPSAAMAHTPSTANAATVAIRAQTSSGSPSAGVPFTVRATGATANETVTLTITRHPALAGKPPRLLTQTANAKGAVEFEVTLKEDGTYTLVSTRANGSVLGRQSVTVVDRGSVIVAGEGAAAAAGDATAGMAAGESEGTAAVGTPGAQLAFTGFQDLGLAAGGGVLVLVGAGVALVSSRISRKRPPVRRVATFR